MRKLLMLFFSFRCVLGLIGHIRLSWSLGSVEQEESLFLVWCKLSLTQTNNASWSCCSNTDKCFRFFTFAIVIHHTRLKSLWAIVGDSRTDKIKSTALIAQKSYVLISGKTFPVDLTVSFIGVPISNNHSTSR